jgi:hypothetical protein
MVYTYDHTVPGSYCIPGKVAVQYRVILYLYNYSYIVDVLATIETTGPRRYFKAHSGVLGIERGTVTWSGLVRAIVHGGVTSTTGELLAKL